MAAQLIFTKGAPERLLALEHLDDRFTQVIPPDEMNASVLAFG